MITQVLHCPYCQGTNIVRHDTTSEGKQRYRVAALNPAHVEVEIWRAGVDRVFAGPDVVGAEVGQHRVRQPGGAARAC